MDDLAGSIIDGRYLTQKFRFRAARIRQPVYVIEDYRNETLSIDLAGWDVGYLFIADFPSALHVTQSYVLSLPYSLKQAIMNMQVHNRSWLQLAYDYF